MLSSLGKTAILIVASTVTSAAFSNQNNAHSYVVGGNSISIETAPGTVALLNRARVDQGNSFFDSQFCGATLIHPQWLVTAAHCVSDQDANSMLALLGSADLTQPVTQPQTIAQVIVHEEYNDQAVWQKDIALLQLANPSTQAAVPLDSQTQAFNDEVFVSGWGASKEGDANSNDEFPTVLQGAALRLIPGVECATIPGFAGAVDNSHVCAASANAQLSGACFGDSGGPLYRLDSNSQVGSLVGIVSGGYVCGDTGVYTNASAYASWISSRAGVTLPTGDVPADEGVTLASGEEDDDDDTLAIAGGAALLGLAAGAVAGSGGWLLPLVAGFWFIRRRINQDV